jgi:methyl-accepting chemotaxis protein
MEEMIRKASPATALARPMIAAGAAIGVALPVLSLIVVQPRSTLGWWVFAAACLMAGVGLGFICHRLAVRTAGSLLADTLQQVGRALGVTVGDSRDLDVLSDRLGQGLNSVGDVLGRIRASAATIRTLTAEVLTATEGQAAGAAEQAAALTQTSATVEELSQTSAQIADNSAAVFSIAEQTLTSAEEGMQSVAQTALGIEEIRESTQQSANRILALGERGQEIGRVLTIIDEIAEQTKILALNAAIEAARAGDAGRGFSVVADEIRSLAESVTASTQEIGRMVRDIQASTAALVMQTERTAATVAEGGERAASTHGALERIVMRVEETTDAAKQISLATRQQRTASGQVVVSMREVSLVSQQAAATSRQISEAILELDSLIDAMSIR